MPEVLVPSARWGRWVTNFEASHGTATISVADGMLRGAAPDGSWFAAALPFSEAYAGAADPQSFADAVRMPPRWGVLLVRKGGFAIARVVSGQIAASKVGQRHVQGRTKAGGQSQQRFARRRANQARVAYEAAADHAARILAEGAPLDAEGAPLDAEGAGFDAEGAVELVVAGGDRSAVAEVLTDPRLRSLRLVGPHLAVPDPRRAVLEQAVLDAQALVVDVRNTPEG